jgi:hypothetical protein
MYMLPDGDAADVAGADMAVMADMADMAVIADMAVMDIMAESYTYNFLVYMILNEFNYS